MNYYRNNIRHVKGDTFSSGLIVEGMEQALESIDFICENNLSDDNIQLFKKSLNNGISLIEYDAEKKIRKYMIRVSPEDTENIQLGTYYYRLKAEINSDVFTIMEGRFIIE